MDRRCLFILFSTILYLSNIQCDDKHHPIDFLKPTNEEKSQHEEVITTTLKKTVEEVISTTAKTNGDELHGIRKFIVDVKNKFNHIHPVRDVKDILFGSSSEEKATTTVSTTSVPSVTTAAPKEDHVEKIIESMPSESEDMIRVVTLKPDEHYGKGKAKPKYLTMELEKMNSTEYVEGITSKTPASSTVTGKSSVEDFSTTTSTQKTTQKNGSHSNLK